MATISGGLDRKQLRHPGRESAAGDGTGVRGPLAKAAGPGAPSPGQRTSRGYAAQSGGFGAAPAASGLCHFYLAEIVSSLNGGNKHTRTDAGWMAPSLLGNAYSSRINSNIANPQYIHFRASLARYSNEIIRNSRQTRYDFGETVLMRKLIQCESA